MKGAAAALARIVRGDTNPLTLLPSLLEAMPTSSRLPLLELLELVGAAGTIGPAEPPAWARALFVNTGVASGVSPELLAALSGVLAGYRPDYRGDRRSGLLGTPLVLTEGASTAAEFEALIARDEVASSTLRFGATVAARYLTNKRREIGLVKAIGSYLELGGSPPDELERVLFAYLVLTARNAQGDKLSALQEVTGGR